MISFCCNGCILAEEGTDKNHPEQNLPDKNSPDKTPQTNSPDKTPQTRTPRTKTNLPVKTCMYACTTENSGVPRCVTYFRGVPRCVTMCDRGRGIKIGPK